MKAKVIIENGETTIILTPENEFETDIIEKMYDKKEKHTIITEACAHVSYSVYSKHRIELSIKEAR